jgi:membrane protein DedA with SNARE-associated domain
LSISISRKTPRYPVRSIAVTIQSISVTPLDPGEQWPCPAIERTGYLGVFLLMLIDNVFPPIPSEVIMPLAGFAAARGQLSLIGVFLAGTAGSLSGALVWYTRSARSQ